MLKWIFKTWVGKGVGWTDLEQDRGWWPAVVNAAMKMWAP